MDLDSGTPFNMAMLFYIGLNELMSKKDIAALQGDLYSWYRGLKAVRRRIYFKAKKHKVQLEEIDKQLQNAKNLLQTPIPRQVYGDMNDRIQDSVTGILEKVDQELWDIMDKEKMIFPDIKTSGGYKAIRDKLGLPGDAE